MKKFLMKEQMKQAEILFSEAKFNYIVTTTVMRISQTENVWGGKLAQRLICVKMLISTAKHSSFPLHFVLPFKHVLRGSFILLSVIPFSTGTIIKLVNENMHFLICPSQASEVFSSSKV